jgi:hypothetical protein
VQADTESAGEQEPGAHQSVKTLRKPRIFATSPSIRTRREANIPSAARPRASTGLGTPPSSESHLGRVDMVGL